MKAKTEYVRIGIDLGTTNSEIAINDGLNVEVITNAEGSLFTPSVVGINRNGNFVVGREAYDQLFKSASTEASKNYQAQVKRKMGLDEKIYFAKTNKSYTPEEISAEILKELKNDLLRRYPEIDTRSAVITIPMAFGTVQSEATKRAGELAGFDHVVILQEPIAAAIAYGLKNNQDANWIVYDLGGGTFDVALISAKDGNITVIEHGGNNYLGGKDFDELIIQEIIKPKLLKNYHFSKGLELSIKDPIYGVTYAHLKALAENAKVKLSTQAKVTFDIFDIKMSSNADEQGKNRDTDLVDDDGKLVDFSFDFTRAEYERLIASKIDETIELMKQVIVKSNINASAISKVILVGAPTLTPYIRQRIAEDLKIPVDTSVNPFTVVAEGAAIFALSQKIPQSILDKDRVFDASEVKLAINYETMTNDLDMLITGKVEVPASGSYFIKISSESGFFNSEKITVTNGGFSTFITLEPQKQNTFLVYLIDEKGNNLNVQPNTFSIVQGMALSGAPIPHEVGVIYAQQDAEGGWKERCFKYFERKSTLPLSKTSTFKTIKDINPGETLTLPVKVYEGDFNDPELNKIVTRIEIDGSQIPYTLAKNSEIDITITISESRILDVEAYIPDIDVTLRARKDMYSTKIESKSLTKEVDAVEEEIGELANMINEEEKESIQQEIAEIKTSLGDNSDAEMNEQLDAKIKNVKHKVTQIKNKTSFDRKEKEYRNLLQELENQLSDVATVDEKREFEKTLELVKEKAEEFITNKNEAGLDLILSQMNQLSSQMIGASPSFWVGFLMYLIQRQHKMRDQDKAEYLANKAKQAIEDNQFQVLKDTVIELRGLLPDDEDDNGQFGISGITK